MDVDLNSDDTDLASIFYTTDGTDPDTSATRTEYTDCYTPHHNYHAQVHRI